jgi:hypothetical protein
MKKLAFALTLSGLLVGGAMAGTIDNSTVYNKTGVKNSLIQQNGSENSQNFGINNSAGMIYKADVQNETYIEGSTFKQNGYRNYQNAGVQN